jgi:hypothetical protein
LINVNIYLFLRSSSVSSSYSSPPWLGAVKFFRPPFFAFPIISPSSLPLHSSGAWLWGWFSRGRLSISPPCGRFKDGSRIEAPSSLFGCVQAGGKVEEFLWDSPPMSPHWVMLRDEESDVKAWSGNKCYSHEFLAD